MIKAEIGENDEARIRALLEYAILDTDPEKDYDDITLLASEICQTPISSIAFFDATRQVLKSNRGLPPGICPREMSFCGHVINSTDDIVIIPDSRIDERFFDNPSVTSEPNVVFYAGVPLLNPDGFALGTLCVIDNEPRQLSDKQLTMLKALANQLVQLLDLRRKNIQMEKIATELASRASELEDANNELEAFNFTVSHDLQSPLQVVGGLAKILSKKYNHTLDDAGKEYLDVINTSVLRMNVLIHDLLDFARLGKAGVKKQEVEMNGIVKVVIEELKLANKNGAAEIKLHDLKSVHGDRGLILQVWSNLIGNAIKYSSKKAKPVIEIGMKETEEEIIYYVKDSGAGFDMKYYSKLFGVFQRMHSLSEFEGSGVGLATVHRIIVKHGGRIWAEGKPDEGAVFYFTIPHSNASNTQSSPYMMQDNLKIA